jgi:hypothetical protein
MKEVDVAVSSRIETDLMDDGADVVIICAVSAREAAQRATRLSGVRPVVYVGDPDDLAVKAQVAALASEMFGTNPRFRGR